MEITLTPDQQKFITEQIASGHYHSVGDVISQSLGMLRAQEEFIRTNNTELREKIDVGLEQIRRGEVVEGKSAIQNLRNQLYRRERGEK